MSRARKKSVGKKNVGKKNVGKKKPMSSHQAPSRPRKRRSNQSGRRPQPWATVGDASPFEYGGGVVYKDGDRYMLEIWPFVEEEIDEDDSTTKTHVFSVEIEDDVFGYHDWAKPKEIASYVDSTAKELRAAGRSDDPLERVRATEDIASYHGWENFDSYPREFTLKELKKRYGKDVDKANAAEKKRALVGREMARRGLSESPVREKNAKDPRPPKGDWLLVRASGLDDKVLSAHKTKVDAEKAMRKHGGEPDSMFQSGMRIVDRSRVEVIPAHAGGWTIRPMVKNPCACSNAELARKLARGEV